jgi:hypothetical protein
MCVVIRDNDYAAEDAGTIYLTWKNGRYVPAPPLFYVPGLRAIFHKQSERARWYAASHNLRRTCILPSTCYETSHAPRPAQGAIFIEGNPHVTIPDFSRHSICSRSAPTAVATSTGYSSEADGADNCMHSHAASRAGDEGQDSSQQSIQSPGSAANTSLPERPYGYGTSPSLVSDNIAEGDISSQKSDSTFSSTRRPLAELSPFNAQNKSRTKIMSLAATGKQPALGIQSNECVTPLWHHASTSSATSLKSILKRCSNSTSTASQGRPQRKKSVRFLFDSESNGPGAGAMSHAVQWPRRFASPPPPATRSKSPPPQHPKRLSSSAGKASLQMMQVRAGLAKVGLRSGGSNNISLRRQRPQANVQPKPKHQALTVENLATFDDWSRNGGRQVDWVWDDKDDTASNTDFELAVRMKRRWI